MKNRLLSVILFLAIMLMPSWAAAEPSIRIAILNKASDFIISVSDKYQMVDVKTGAVFTTGNRIVRSRVITNMHGIAIGKNIYATEHLRIVADSIKIQTRHAKKLYRNSIDIIVQPNQQLLVVNGLDLESYVRGVLFHEISDDWPMEAMKAQAVAVRTYGLYQTLINKKQPFDVSDDIYSQVYGGKSAERYRTNLAVTKTQGEVLMYNNNVLPAYFHSNSGGHTEDAKELWNIDLPPLKGRVDDYVKYAPGYEWKKNFRSSEVQEKLNENGFKIGMIKDIAITERTVSGRVKTLVITDRDIKRVTIPGKTFRSILGPNNLRSNLYDVVMQGYYFDLVGKGWGHGVGLSQWGAYFMAKKRFTYNEILQYYYPGATLTPYKKSS